MAKKIELPVFWIFTWKSHEKNYAVKTHEIHNWDGVIRVTTPSWVREGEAHTHWYDRFVVIEGVEGDLWVLPEE